MDPFAVDQHHVSGAPLFVFGSLMDSDLLSVVLGRPAAVMAEPAVLGGFKRRRARDEVFPILVPDLHDGTTVDGLLIDGLEDHDLDRILFYEGAGYALRPLVVEDGRRRRRSARVFLSTGLLQDSGEPWHLDQWQGSEKAYALLLAEELMTFHGTCAVEDVEGAVWADIKARCLARLEDSAGDAVRTAVAR